MMRLGGIALVASNACQLTEIKSFWQWVRLLSMSKKNFFGGGTHVHCMCIIEKF